METAERIGRKTSFSRNKKAQKLLNISGFRVLNQLLRMRSPVQIWIAAPQKPLKSLDLGGFCLIYSTFRGRLKFSNGLVAGGMGFLQKILQFLRGARASKSLRRKGHPAQGQQQNYRSEQNKQAAIIMIAACLL